MMNYLEPIQIVNNQSMTDTFSSTPVDITLMDNVGLQIAWSGTPTGTITIECSMDYKVNKIGSQGVLNAGNWTALTVNPSISQPAGAAGLVLANLNQLPFPWVRVTYTAVSGTGTLNVWMAGKSV